MDVWQQTCQQLYLPRLRDDTVFHNTLGAGAEGTDFFGFAQGKEGDRYLGFSFGKRTTPVLDSSLLLIEPETAKRFKDSERAATEVSVNNPSGDAPLFYPTSSGSSAQGVADSASNATSGVALSSKVAPHHFFAAIDVDPVMAKKQFVDLIDEVVLHFSAKPGVKVNISIEIAAESPHGFDESTQRTVKENCSALKFKSAEFD